MFFIRYIYSTKAFSLRLNKKCAASGEKYSEFLKLSTNKFYSSAVKKSKTKNKNEPQAVTDESDVNISVEGIGKEEKLEELCVSNCTKETHKSKAEGTKKHDSKTGGDNIDAYSDMKLSDFFVKNITSFPLHVPLEDTKLRNVENSKFMRSSFPSVTAILHETMSSESKKVLERWKQNMINEMGMEKFNNVQNATLNRGKKFHSALKRYLEGEEMSEILVDKEVEGCWNSVKPVLPYISDIKLVEANITHPYLHYKGIVDCVANYKNVPHVIEWKQSEKNKKSLSSTYDAPVQLSAYMGALAWCDRWNVSEPITNGLIVVAYIDGSPADIFSMNSDFCQSYWEQWLLRVQSYWATRLKGLK